MAVARPVQAGAGQAERRPGAARPDCVPHATAAGASGNASLRDVQVNSMAVRVSTTKTILRCRPHHCWQPAKSRDLPIRRKIGMRSAPQQVRQLGASQLRRAWNGAREMAGLGSDVTPHTLKHSCATLMLQNGVSTWNVAGLLGTSEAVIRKVYGHHAISHLREAADVWSRRPRIIASRGKG